MGHAIGIRLPKEVLEIIEKLGREESEDRSTVIRKLVMLGYKDLAKKKASDNYMRGKITISEAAHQAGMTIWEMEKYLVEAGFKSEYSVEDLKKELKMLGKS